MSTARAWLVAAAVIVSLAAGLSASAAEQPARARRQPPRAQGEVRAPRPGDRRRASTASSATRSSTSRRAIGSPTSNARRFPTASTIKLAIVYELFKQVDEGAISLDETIDARPRARPSAAAASSFELGHADAVDPRLRGADGHAQRQHRDQRPDRSTRHGRDRQAHAGRSAWHATKLRRHMMDTAAARRGDENVSTPDEHRAAARRRDTPRAMPTGDRAAEEAEGEPAAARVCRRASRSADKPGELDGVRVDAGIVFAKNRPVRVRA